MIKEQKRIYKYCVESAEKIIIIGVRSNGYDRHIFDPLEKSAAKVITCCGADGAAYAKLVGKDRHIDLACYWDEAEERIIEELTKD